MLTPDPVIDLSALDYLALLAGAALGVALLLTFSA
jgi:hypothetical protein